MRRLVARAEPCGASMVLGTARTYRQLMDILAARRRDLGLSQLATDFAAGFQDGYCGKLEIGAVKPAGRNLGQWSTERLLRALGLRLVVELDPDTEEKERFPDAAKSPRALQYDRSSARSLGSGGEGNDRQRSPQVDNCVDRDAA